MIFFKAVLSASLALGLSAAAPNAHPPLDAPFRPYAFRGDDYYHYTNSYMLAWNSFFYLREHGRHPTTSCPAEISNCPPGNVTQFKVNPKTKEAFMDVELPGGQQIYLDAKGRLRYQLPGQAQLPKGALTTPFTVHYKDNSVGGGYFGYGNPKKVYGTFEACEIGSNDYGPKDVYSLVHGNKHDNQVACYEFGVIPYKPDFTPAAYQYD